MACKCAAGFRVFTVMPDTPKAAEASWVCGGTGERHVARLVDIDRTPGGEMDGRPIVFEVSNPDGGATIFACDVPPGGIEELRARMDDAVAKLHNARSEALASAAALVKANGEKWVKEERAPAAADLAELAADVLKLRDKS